MLANIAASVSGAEGAPPLIGGTGRDDTHLLIVCTAERGLAGAFNSSIARLARDHARRLRADGKTVKFFLVGKKGYDILRREFDAQIVERTDLRAVKQLAFADAQKVAQRVIAMFEEGAFDVATLFYSRFQSVISQVPTARRLIPAEVPAGKADQATSGGAIYEYEPSEQEILADLLPRTVAIQIFRALLENAASEQGARMSAMDNATRNAGEMIEGLTLSYNRRRQAQITKELIEIISGAEAL